MSDAPLVALVGDRRDGERAHARIEKLLPALGLTYLWHGTDTVGGPEVFRDACAIWVVPGSPYKSMDGALTAIRYARESGVPYLGTCGGFQHALIEWCRNVLCLAGADDTQSAPEADLPLITPLSCSLRGELDGLRVAEGSRLAAIYGCLETQELYHCCYGLNPRFDDLFFEGDLRVCAWDRNDSPRAVELDGHPFFVGTLYQPELVSDEHTQHRLLTAFAAAVHAHADAKDTLIRS